MLRQVSFTVSFHYCENTEMFKIIRWRLNQIKHIEKRKLSIWNASKQNLKHLFIMSIRCNQLPTMIFKLRPHPVPNPSPIHIKQWCAKLNVQYVLIIIFMFIFWCYEILGARCTIHILHCTSNIYYSIYAPELKSQFSFCSISSYDIVCANCEWMSI